MVWYIIAGIVGLYGALIWYNWAWFKEQWLKRWRDGWRKK